MCGIAGWVDWERDLGNEHRVLDAMTGTLAPRGPDDGGTWLSRQAALGHRRLAVVDVEGGRQPMTAARGGEAPCVVTFSGEIYNFRELRRLLTSCGHRFRTSSDTEVLLRSYLEWGAECVTRLDGMFAFALWDPGRRALLLARDRLGVKPLYFLPYPNGVVFGSELKTLLAHPFARPEVTPDGLAAMLCVTPVPGRSVFRRIRAVRPGHLVLADADGRRERPYWRLESHEHPDDHPTTVRTVRRLLKDAVERQLVSDVPIGALLSGGLDSSAITALAADVIGHDGVTPTYSVGFQDQEKYFTPDATRPEQDSVFAHSVAETLRTRHTEILLHTEDVLRARSEVLRARDVPGFADINAAQYLMFRVVKKEVTVVLSGDAADESLGGYPWFHSPAARAQHALPWAAIPQSVCPVLDGDLRRRVARHLADDHAQAMTEVPRLPGEDPLGTRIRELFHLNLTRWLPLMLDFTDRTSMRAGLEVRVPFCDHRLVEYLWNTPWHIKSPGGRVKGLLRDAMAGALPAHVLERRKTSFPVNVHPDYEAGLREQMRAELSDRNSALSPLVDRAALLALLARPCDSPGMWRVRDTLALLLQTAEWLRAYRVVLC
ncbi:asparagine synthase (glutamine-hydrolyzing) [Streptomyces sp. NPDC004629]|uniref:asparagine synthase (glutamine-hydrolyzing) n=1 Tax=Streptomyces sp. NPDC004629 TaxID=3364705 RepID=UPI0036815920